MEVEELAAAEELVVDPDRAGLALADQAAAVLVVEDLAVDLGLAVQEVADRGAAVLVAEPAGEAGRVESRGSG